MFNLSQLQKRLSLQTGTGIIGEDQAVKAAVLIPLIKKNDEWELLFEVRSRRLKSQPGDICFPGGKQEDSDNDLQQTAIRETSEELGIPMTSIQVLGPLDRYVPSSRIIIYPYVGIINTHDFHISKNEVDEIFTVPMSWLLEATPDVHRILFEPQPPEDFPYERIALGKEYKWKPRQLDELFYHYGNHSVWGMTARILQHFITVVKAP
ncbi:coenzyme A pyrophosphatase [Pullulanibacillus camelliae]|uniref:Coenzyme A pyrophosphatase n=1 Tax=Pullulanibacillus camelliae TaxID=1707096 RepID=A0A8J2YIM0_9BACL|nr:CoA pyrophosphatase [Pullulanibacillus camelliae]GGE45571.1 coenzyme A pyrophosphatase [Pullulanibacillus camelliae]